MISNVGGAFKDFKATAVTLNDDFSKAYISLTVAVASISTDNEQRNRHLLGEDFFDAASFPEIKFVSTNLEKIKEGLFMLTGDLAIKGVTKMITLHVEFGGLTSDERHGTKAGFTITGKINQPDWGISFNRILDTGGMGLGEEVKISVNYK